jgi:MoxR-like ATPase
VRSKFSGQTFPEANLLYLSRAAIDRALPEIGRSSLFADLLMMRYCAPDAESLTAEVRSPTVANGSFTEAVRGYAGLVPAPADAAAPGWRLHESVAPGEWDEYFFALAAGGTGRQKRWKQGGDFYARAGLHNRLYGGLRGPLAECVASYAPSEVGEDRWTLRFAPDYVVAAFQQLLDERPIPFWSFASWMMRTVAIPRTLPEEALDWVQRTVMEQARLSDAHVADSRVDAIARNAWFYLGARPEASQMFGQAALDGGELRRICEHFDELFRRDPSRSDEGRDPAPATGNLLEMLTDAGDGRRLKVDDEVLSAALTHLSLGRHLLLVGPPGTGKSTFAANLARAARDELIVGVAPPSDFHTATASASWTAFDTLGGYMPTRQGDLAFRPGVFLRAFDSDAWLVVDELNRADADKAFGPFMALLAGSRERLELPFEVMRDGSSHPVRLVSGEDSVPRLPGDVIVPAGWRLIATMNTYDKNSLFRMSYAFMRRFAFVYVGTSDVDTTLEAATQGLQLDGADETRLRSLLVTCEAAGRALGIAIAADVARYVERARQYGDISEPFLDALVAHVLPQLDSLEPDGVRRVLESLLSLGVVAEGARARLEGVFAQLLDYER